MKVKKKRLKLGETISVLLNFDYKLAYCPFSTICRSQVCPLLILFSFYSLFTVP